MKRKSTGSRPTASGAAAGKSKAHLIDRGRRYPYLAICVENRGNEASLELGKAYKVIRPLPNDFAGRIRVIDEDGEDYLYLREWFVPVKTTPQDTRRVMAVVGT